MRALLARLSLFTTLSVSNARALEYEYEAPASCPDQAAFVQATRARLEHPEAHSSVERLQVTVVEKQGFHAELTLFEEGFAPVTRDVSASDCEQAVLAIALAAALALDARYTRASPPIESSPPPGGSQSPHSAVAEPAPSPRSNGSEPSQPPGPDAFPRPPPPARASEQPQPTSQGAAHASPSSTTPPAPMDPDEARTLFVRTAWGAFAATGYSPRPTLGPSLELALERDPAILVLRGFYGFESTASQGSARARFWVWGARLLPCYAPRLTSDFSFSGCASLEHARVLSRGLENGVVVEGRHGNTPFWALGASLGLRFGLRRGLSVHADLGAQFPLIRERFGFVNDDGTLPPPVHRYPRVAARLDLGIGRRW